MLLDFVIPFAAFAADIPFWSLIAVVAAWVFGIGMTTCIAINRGQSGVPWALYAAIFPPMAFIHALLLAPFNYQSVDFQHKQTVELLSKILFAHYGDANGVGARPRTVGLLEKIAITQADILKALQESNRDENAGESSTSNERV